MIFADKLIGLRKKSGWSQEELAEQMGVTRQSISKWEGAQSIPDLDKIIRLSELFGVSTDYLLKDTMEEVEISDATEHTSGVRWVSLEEANQFLEVKRETAKPIAYATFLCILSPIVLMMLGAMSENPKYGISETVAGSVGMIVLLVLIAIAVVIFITNGSKTEKFLYLEKEVFETQYGVTGMVKECKEKMREEYTKNNVIGVCLCVFSIVPLFIGAMIDENNDVLLVAMISIMFMMVGIAVIFFVRVGVIWASFEKLLQEGDYTKPKKENMSFTALTSGVYWLLATAIFLGVSLPNKSWNESWIIWVVAGVLFPAVLGVAIAIKKQCQTKG